MEITEIKSRLSIKAILSHYNLTPNKNGMLCCPFHADQKASMKIYFETNTVYCFAGNCKVNNLDQIDFIMKMEKGTKHEAIEKAKTLINGTTKPQKEISFPTIKSKPKDLQSTFNKYLKSLATNQPAKQYLEDRKLKTKQLEIGFKGRSAKDKWANNCVIFPLKNEANQIVSLYGRAIKGDGHYYQSNRSGLYPNFPSIKTKRLVLCESIIDTASLLQLKSGFTFLALFGTNGLTKEHLEAIDRIENLEEVIFILDGDLAGRAATKVHAQVLAKLYPGIKLTEVILPDGEDVNSMLVSHDEATKLFSELFENRSGVELKQAAPEKKKEIFYTADPYHIIYKTDLAEYVVKGGLRNSPKDLDSLKITLLVTSETGLKSRNKLDLYEDKQVEKISIVVAEKLDLNREQVELDLQGLTDELEVYRHEIINTPLQEESDQVILSAAEKQAAVTFLKQKNLIQKFNELIGKAGITGEEKNRLLLFVVASSYQMPDTLHALIQGASGSGKTRLLRVISDLMPEEKVKRYTRVTDSSFYNQGEYYFTNKLLCFEDIDGLKEDALLAVRELQSNEILITSTSIKDEAGSIKGGERIVRGPIASISCTTKAAVYEDNISRCFVVAVDESQSQSLRIIKYQNEKAAGLIDRSEESKTKVFIQNCIRLLQPLEVINPFANKVQLPKNAHKIRRLNELYQSFVRQLTLLNQYQRKRDPKGRLITEKADLKMACDILFESIVLKVDELDGSLRQFYETLKVYVKAKGDDYKFDRFEIKKITKVSKATLHRKIRRLIDLEYINQYGFGNRGYHYKIAHWDDIGVIRSSIKKELENQLLAL